MAKSKPPKRTDPLKSRPKSEKYVTERILYGRTGRPGPASSYDPDYHPDSVVRYFQAARDKLAEAERVRTERGQVSYVQAPVHPPTLAGWAAEQGVSKSTVSMWQGKHEEFEEAVALAKTIQEDVIVRMAALGAYDPRWAAFVMKNLQGWVDRVDQKHEAHVTLVFDKQDEEA